MKKILNGFTIILSIITLISISACDSDKGTIVSNITDNTEITQNKNPVDAEIKEMQSIVNIPQTGTTNSDSDNISEENRSAKPELTVVKHSENTRIFIAGSCSADAVIHIKGGLEEKTYSPDQHSENGISYFMGETDFEDNGLFTSLTVTAEEKGKAESLPITITVKARNDVTHTQDMGAYGVIVGDTYQEHVYDMLSDYTGDNLLSDSEIDTVTKRIASNVQYLKNVNKDSEIIYFLIPTQMKIYPETVPDRFIQCTDNSLTDQFSKCAKDAGAVVVDLSKTFFKHKNDEYKLYHKTDTHWTHYGVFLGYTELMNYISQKWTDAVPRPASDFRFYYKLVGAGDMQEHLGVDTDAKLLKEYTCFAELLFDSPSNPEIYLKNRNILFHSNTQDEHTVVNNNTDKKLPKALIYRDSYGTPAYAVLNDTFSSVYWKGLWNYDYDKSAVEDFKPDYVIYLITERCIKSILHS